MPRLDDVICLTAVVLVYVVRGAALQVKTPLRERRAVFNSPSGPVSSLGSQPFFVPPGPSPGSPPGPSPDRSLSGSNARQLSDPSIEYINNMDPKLNGQGQQLWLEKNRAICCRSKGSCVRINPFKDPCNNVKQYPNRANGYAPTSLVLTWFGPHRNAPIYKL